MFGRLNWLSAKKEKGKVLPAETFGTLHLSDRFEDGKVRLMLRDPEGQEFALVALVVKESEAEDAKTSIQIVFEKH